MWQHFINLLHHSWEAFIGELGTTTLGLISSFLPSVLASAIVAAILFYMRGWSAIKEHGKKNVDIVLISAVLGNLLWFVPLFGWSVIKTVYRDHQQM